MLPIFISTESARNHYAVCINKLKTGHFPQLWLFPEQGLQSLFNRCCKYRGGHVLKKLACLILLVAFTSACAPTHTLIQSEPPGWWLA